MRERGRERETYREKGEEERKRQREEGEKGGVVLLRDQETGQDCITLSVSTLQPGALN